MALSKYSELHFLRDAISIAQEISTLKKSLFNLRMKRSTNSAIKPHEFLHLKRRIAQLKLKESNLVKLSNNN